MQINIVSIQKSQSEFQNENEKYIKLISKYASIKDISIFNNKIAKAQSKNQIDAKKSYSEHFLQYKKGFNIALDEKSKELNSIEFANLIKDKNEISFFIGGAYGIEDSFLKNVDFNLSLSKLTLAHKFVKLLLLEQIFRAFCINNNHPYHK